MISSFSNVRDVVLDPFMGSGTVALAAYKLKRKYVGFEISEKYYNLINKRLEELKMKG